jgi:glycosyltransferase involved in cell wall biosynthesis
MSTTFSVVLPYFNEAGFVAATLRSWLAQTRPPDEIILVDNGSTDGSERICRDVLGAGRGRVECHYLKEPKPGKLAALAAGAGRASGSFLVFSDADTLYPPHYLRLCESLLGKDGPGLVALMALPVSGNPASPGSRLGRRAYVGLSRVFPGHTYTGGYGQVLRRDAFERCGGYSEGLWPYVLADHEIMARLLRLGTALYHVDLWCQPSPRRKDRRRVRWTVGERFLYHVTPHRWHDWFFGRFLRRRFARRGLVLLNLREKPWAASPPAPGPD